MSIKLEPIDTSTTEGKAEVMLLAAKGRKVARRLKAGAFVDYTGYTPYWNWGSQDYAIIAEPVGPEVIWVNIYRDSVAGHTSEEHAMAVASSTAIAKAVRYIRAD